MVVKGLERGKRSKAGIKIRIERGRRKSKQKEGVESGDKKEGEKREQKQAVKKGTGKGDRKRRQEEAVERLKEGIERVDRKRGYGHTLASCLSHFTSSLV